MINKKEIIVHGLKRSGHHAIINWILRQSPTPQTFINDVRPDRNPFLTRNAYSQINCDRRQEAEGRLTPKELLIYSYEDRTVDSIYTEFFSKYQIVHVGESETRFHLLSIRDPFNHFASRLQTNRKGSKWAWGKEDEFNIYHYRNLWINHAKEFIGFTNYIPDPKVCIDYVEWCDSEMYRRQLAETLSIHFTDAGFNEVTKAGGGSAFDGRKFDSEASKMHLHERWREFVNDEYYLRIFDDNILALASQIWKDRFDAASAIIRQGHKIVKSSSAINILNAPKKVGSILFDLQCNTNATDRPVYIPSMFHNMAKYLHEERKIKVYAHLLRGSKALLRQINGNNSFYPFTEIVFDESKLANDVDKEMKEVDCYLGFCGFKHRGKRKHCHLNRKPNLVYESGPLYNSILLDPISIYGDGEFARQMPMLLEGYPIGDTSDYCRYAIDNKISKRSQNGTDPIPDHPYILVPGQALRDTSITRCSQIDLLSFIDEVAHFAKEHGIIVVFKPHPGLLPNKNRHGKEEQIDHCSKNPNIRIVDNSIFELARRSLFVANVNSACVVDCFIAGAPVYTCAYSFYMQTGATLYHPDIRRGLETMYNRDYDSQRMKKKQLQIIAWLRNNMLFEHLSPIENIKRVERLSGVKF